MDKQTAKQIQKKAKAGSLVWHNGQQYFWALSADKFLVVYMTVWGAGRFTNVYNEAE